VTDHLIPVYNFKDTTPARSYGKKNKQKADDIARREDRQEKERIRRQRWL